MIKGRLGTMYDMGRPSSPTIVLSCGRVTGGLLGSGGAILGLINQSRLKYVRRQN
jgi:hypothetical protein